MNLRVWREPGGNVILSVALEDLAAAEERSGSTTLVYGGGEVKGGHWPVSAGRCWSGCFGCEECPWPMELEDHRLSFMCEIRWVAVGMDTFDDDWMDVLRWRKLLILVNAALIS